MAVKRQTQTAGSPSLLKQFWAFSASLKLLMVILGLGSVPLVVGTLIQQKPLGGFDPEKVLEQLGPHIFALCEVFGVFDIYHSWYFTLLLVLLAYNNICCTIDRFFLNKRWRTLKGVGVIIIHVGVNIVLVGSFIGSRTGQEGFMQVFENGPPVDRMVNFTTMREIPLPFSVQLDDFRLQMYDEPEELVFLIDRTNGDNQHAFLIHSTDDLPHTYAIGRQDLISKAIRWLRGGAKQAIQVEQYFPDAVLEPVVKPTPDGSGIWAVELETTLGEHGGHGYVAADTGRRQELLAATLSVNYVRTYNPAQLEQALGSRPDYREPTLIVYEKRTGLTSPFPVEVGDQVGVMNNTATVRVLEYRPNFARPDDPAAAPTNPALRVELTDGDHAQVGWLFAKFTAASAVQSDRLRLGFAQGLPPGSTPHEVDFVVGPDDARYLAYRHNGQAQRVEDAPPGHTFVVPETGTRLTVLSYVDGGESTMEVRNRSDHTHSPAVQVTLLDDGKPVSTKWLFDKQAVDIAETPWRLVYQRNFNIREFQSDLSIIKDGRKIIEDREIIVNRPLSVDGYHIFQSSYDQQSGRWSGLQIKKDPGIPIIYSGFVMMFAGIIFLFYVRPVIEARRKGTPLVAEAKRRDENVDD